MGHFIAIFHLDLYINVPHSVCDNKARTGVQIKDQPCGFLHNLVRGCNCRARYQLLFFFTKMVLKGMIKEPFEESGSVIWVVKTRVEASEYTHTQLRSVPLHKADLYIKSISALSIHHKVNLWVISSDKWTRALVSLYLIKVDAVRAFQMHRSLARGHHQEHVWVEVRTVKVFLTCDFIKEYHASI